MKVRIIGNVTIKGCLPGTEKVTEKSFWVETTVSFPFLPRIGEILTFNDSEEDFDLIPHGKVKDVRWLPSKDKVGVLSPEILLEDHLGTYPDEFDFSIETEYDRCVACMKHERPGKIAFEPCRS
jgi:hypothetical protein